MTLPDESKMSKRRHNQLRAEWLATVTSSSWYPIFSVIALGSILTFSFTVDHGNTNIANIAVFLAALFSAGGALSSLALMRRFRKLQRDKQIFIIHAREDEDYADKIAASLESNGFHAWIDKKEILPGQKWKDQISDALSESAGALVLISNSFNQSDQSSRELDAAIKIMRGGHGRKFPIIPIRVDDALPPNEIRDIQWAEIKRDGDIAKVIRQLEKSIAD